MITLTITFESKKELCEFLGNNMGSAPVMAAATKAVAKPKAEKPKAEKPKADKPTATQGELRKALKAFATGNDPEMARSFLESLGVSKISELGDDPEVYGAAIESLKGFGKADSDG